jgi:hypothetical protein
MVVEGYLVLGMVVGCDERVASLELGETGRSLVDLPQDCTTRIDGSRGRTCSQRPVTICERLASIVRDVSVLPKS